MGWTCLEHGHFEDETGMVCPICGVVMFRNARGSFRRKSISTPTIRAPSSPHIYCEEDPQAKAYALAGAQSRLEMREARLNSKITRYIK